MYFLLKEIENEKGLVLNLHIPWTWPLGDIRFYLYNRTEIVLKFPQVLALSQMKTIQTTYCTLLFFFKEEPKRICNRCWFAIAKDVLVLMKCNNTFANCASYCSVFWSRKPVLSLTSHFPVKTGGKIGLMKNALKVAFAYHNLLAACNFPLVEKEFYSTQED